MLTKQPKTHRLVEQRRVDRSQQDVFEYTADFRNIQDWDPGVTASRMISEGPVGVGSLFDLDVRFGKGSIPMTYEITVFDPNSRVVLEGRGEKLEAVDDIRFSTRDGLTVIDYVADLKFHNFFKYLGPLLRPSLKKVGEKALDGLASRLNA